MLEEKSLQWEEDNEPVASVNLSDLWTSETAVTGQIDLEALAKAQGPEEEPEPFLSSYDRNLCAFVVRRTQEAQMVQAFNCFPDDIPWNRQPWWVVDLWRTYWSAESKGREDKD